jgi:large subunit ribosomal protein L44
MIHTYGPFQAAEDSLHRLYLTRQPPELVSLPTTTFPSTARSVLDGKDQSEGYVPGAIGESEVNYGWSSKGGRAVGGKGQRLPGGAVFVDEAEVDVPSRPTRRA